MTVSVEELFQATVKRYEAGEAAVTLIPDFVEICKQSTKLSAAWTCLSWLYLLEQQPEAAFKAAQKAVNLDRVDAQPRVNLALAMLETGRKGVRDQVEMIQGILISDNEQIDLVKANIQEGRKRRADWTQLSKIEQWLFN
ncbi:MAG: hypothetical protein HC921_19590 [Synechococcaceae cyanobacterium SM2_3_1]|nr:hypothetical protein [Synechococcaceae cyanobacterium SM2_3_1]